MGRVVPVLAVPLASVPLGPVSLAMILVLLGSLAVALAAGVHGGLGVELPEPEATSRSGDEPDPIDRR